MTTEEPIMRTLNCTHCKKRISATTHPTVVGFCDTLCLQNYKRGRVAKEDVLNSIEFREQRDQNETRDDVMV